MLANAITAVSDFLWGWPLIIILFGTHIFMTIRTGFIQKDVFKAIKLSVTPDKGATGNVSQFGALTTALSSTIGTGNIVGVGTAIALGGPGAVLWMWITGLLGMATKYSETIIAVKYRVKGEKGDMIGGIQSITRVAEKLVPIMAVFYVAGCIAILVMNHAYLGATVVTILKAAFTVRAAGGGFIGSTIMMAARYGTARGLFSNESGMGSAPLVAAAAQTRNPKRQALVSMTGTFWDTVVICLMTGLVLVSCVLRHPAIDATSGNGANLTAQSFGSIPYIGTPILILGLISFAFSTILGWYYYGERCLVYLFGEQVIFLYKILWIIGVIVGSLMELNLVWSASELLNGLMAIPNIVAVLLLSAEIAKDTKRYKGKHIDDVDDTEIPVVRNAKRGVLHIPMEDPNHTDW